MWVAKTLTLCTNDSTNLSKEISPIVSLSFVVVSHYNLFPRSFGQVINKYDVEELHLSLTQGFWNTDQWGYHSESSSPGAELVAWFQYNALKRWWNIKYL